MQGCHPCWLLRLGCETVQSHSSYSVIQLILYDALFIIILDEIITKFSNFFSYLSKVCTVLPKQTKKSKISLVGFDAVFH